jgi:hypothetical protein
MVVRKYWMGLTSDEELFNEVARLYDMDADETAP